MGSREVMARSDASASFPDAREVVASPDGKAASGVAPLVTTYERPYPFKRGEVTLWDEDGGHTKPTWVPGWDYEPDGPESMAPVWNGEGHEIRTVVSIHTPAPRYPTRVFYTRRWRDPDGHEFGRAGLRITTAAAFRRWLNIPPIDRLRAEGGTLDGHATTSPRVGEGGDGACEAGGVEPTEPNPPEPQPTTQEGE